MSSATKKAPAAPEKKAPEKKIPLTPEQKAEKRAARKAAKETAPARVLFRKETDPKLTGIPTDYDARKHLPLKKTDFESSAVFFELKAIQAEKAAARYREQAQEAKTLGDSKERVKIKKLKKLTADIASLTESLKAEGVDVEAFLKSFQK